TVEALAVRGIIFRYVALPELDAALAADRRAATRMGSHLRASALALAAAVVAAAARAGWGAGPPAPLMLAAAIVMIASSVATTHAMARLDARAPLLLASALHQTGAFLWIGGIPYFLIALAGVDAPAARARIALRFSKLCVAAVLAIAVSMA